jgi:hypothetical protein
VAHLFLCGVRVALEKIGGRHDHSRRAVAALETVVLPERLLQRMEPAVGGEALDRRDLGAVGLCRQHGAALHRLAVQVHRTGAAVGGVAAYVRAGQPETIAQQVNQ